MEIKTINAEQASESCAWVRTRSHGIRRLYRVLMGGHWSGWRTLQRKEHSRTRPQVGQACGIDCVTKKWEETGWGGKGARPRWGWCARPRCLLVLFPQHKEGPFKDWQQSSITEPACVEKEVERDGTRVRMPMVNTFVDWQVRLSDLTEQIIFLTPHNHYKIILGPLKKIHENSLWYYNHKVTQTFGETKPQNRNIFLNSTNPSISMYQDSMFSKNPR